MKKILLENALEAWSAAIYYCDEIMAGKVTLFNRKHFVSSLQNAIELFAKQRMLDSNDYRVAIVKQCDANGEPSNRYYDSKDLNNFFFVELSSQSMRRFYTIEFNRIKDLHKEIFSEFFDSPEGEPIKDALTILQRLRNEETHFFITESDFLKETEFRDLYNMMIVLYKILKYYHLLPYWGEAHGKYKRFSFDRDGIKQISYKSLLKNAQYVKNIKNNIEGMAFPGGGGREAYSIAEDIICVCDTYSDADFHELWTYIQVLIKNNMLTIVDSENGHEIIREYTVKL